MVEDAAHAFGSRFRESLGISSYACFSFDGIKNITSGEGGAVVTDNLTVKAYVDDARLLGVSGDLETVTTKKNLGARGDYPRLAVSYE